MTSKLTITRGHLEEIRDYDTCVTLGESAEMARMALAAMDSEPVAYMHDGEDGREYNGHNEFSGGGKGIPLYRHAQPPVTDKQAAVQGLTVINPDEWVPCSPEYLGDHPRACGDSPRVWCEADKNHYHPKNWPAKQPVPVVPEGIRQALSKMDDEIIAELDAEESACRAAMLQAGNCRGNSNSSTNNFREISETSTGFDNLTFDEHRKYIGLANIEIRRFQTIPDKKYMADLLTIAVNSLYESINTCGEVSSPVIPDGYVMVPKEPTDEMIAAAMNCDDVEFNSDETFCVNFGNIYEAMLEAAPTGIPVNSNAWIPVSERMPEDSGTY